MNTNAKYLRVTIHDNDFIGSLSNTAEILYKIFQFEDGYPTEKQLPELKEYIKYIWFGANKVKDLMRWGSVTKVGMEYLTPKMEFVDFCDIPDWDNHESVYIPMFDDAEIIIR